MRVLAIVAVLLFARVATADPEVAAALEQARHAKAALRYADALGHAKRALAMGRSGPAELVAIHRLIGELAAGLDDAATARAHFQAWLALAPKAALPAGTSPKITAPADGARADLAGRGLGVGFEVSGDTLIMRVSEDPAALVAGVRIHLGGGRSAQASGSRIDLPPGTARVGAAAIDRFGNELTTAEVVVVAASAAPAPIRRRRRPLYTRWWLWAGTAAVFGATSTVFAIRVANAEDEHAAIVRESGMHTLAEAESVASRGRRDAVIANVGFGLAGAAAVVSIIMMVRDAGDERERVSASAGAGPGGFWLGLAGEL